MAIPSPVPTLASVPGRRSVFSPFMAVAGEQFRWCILQLREYALFAWLPVMVEMLVARQLWIALYQGRVEYNGATLSQTLTYAVLGMIVNKLVNSDYDPFIHYKIRSGDILFDLISPLRLTRSLLAFSLSSVMVTVLTTGLPMALVAIFLLRIPLPADPVCWLAFSASFLLGCLISALISIPICLLGFWLTEMKGLMVSMNILVAILSGGYLPLWILPTALERATAWLPFRSTQYVPLAMLIGRIGPELYLREFAIQLAWVAILWLVTEGMYILAMRHVGIQGG